MNEQGNRGEGQVAPVSARMSVFISWSGSPSELHAKALREWLPMVLHFADPWESKSDIDAGSRWSTEIATRLEGSNCGILCINRGNMNAPWVLFEAGALAKSLAGGRVIPLLFNMDQRDLPSTSPLSQLQAKKADRDGMFETVVSLNKAGREPLSDSRLEGMFKALWPKLEAELAAIPDNVADKSGATGKRRSTDDVLEELVESVRGMEAQLRTMPRGSVPWTMNEIPQPARTSPNRIVPLGYAEPLSLGATMLSGMEASNDGLLLLASEIGNEFPAVYDLAYECYAVAESGDNDRLGVCYKLLINQVSIAFVDLRVRRLNEDKFRTVLSALRVMAEKLLSNWSVQRRETGGLDKGGPAATGS